MTRDLLRFATAGSVDDGKSTLVGRLLYDTKSVLADQIEAVHRASVDKGLATPDLSLLVDGLRAEREQGITIDVAYRYFSTPKREFVLADTPGHVQYTRNTVTGASTAELAVLLVDARSGVVEQTRRHAAVLALLRVPRLVLAINKIDLVGYEEEVLRRSRRTSRAWPARSGSPTTPTSRSRCPRCSATTWSSAPRTPPGTRGPRCCTTWSPCRSPGPRSARRSGCAVQYVIRHHATDYRGYAGQVAAGTVAPGDEVVVLPGGARTTVAAVDTADGALPAAGAGRSVTIRLADDIDISRGDVLAAADAAPTVTSELDATLCWLSDKPLRPGARLLVKHGTRTTQAIVGALGDRLDTDTIAWVDAPSQLAINDIARVTLRTADPLPVDDYAAIRATGSFLLIDPPTGNTLAAGLIGVPLTLAT